MVLSAATLRASCNPPLQRRLQRVCLAAVAVSALLVLAACGGSSTPSAATPQSLLSQTFGADVAKIHSGVVSLTINADLDGLKLLDGKPLSLQLSGPFIESGGSATAFDFVATLTVRGQTVPLGLLSASGKTYLEFGGSYYSLPSSTLGSLHPATTGASGGAGILAKLGVDPLDWLTGLQLAGSATVGGVATTHITGQIDVANVVTDLAKLANDVPGAEGRKISDTLSPTNQAAIAGAVNSSSVGLYVGARDHILRESRIALTFTIPAAGASLLDGVTGGSLALDATITDLNSPETITAPKSSQPLSGLLGGGGGQLFGL
jgi:hypothetical protein